MNGEDPPEVRTAQQTPIFGFLILVGVYELGIPSSWIDEKRGVAG